MKQETGNADWTARSEKPRRSVFGNYEPDGCRLPDAGLVPEPEIGKPAFRVPGLPTPAVTPGGGLQAAIDAAVARSFLYQFLARAFEDPSLDGWAWLTGLEVQLALRPAAVSLALADAATALAAHLRLAQFESFQSACISAFGHAARGDCPLNEIEYGDLKADPLFQPHRLADLAAFYRAFGLEVADSAAERPDHLGMELEFMGVLAAKEAYALEHQLDDESGALCRDAQRKFLREHLGRWTPAFARRLARTAADGALAALAEFLRAFIDAECARFNVPAGSEDLLLRPVDEAAESLCASCGLKDLPPGATAMSATA